MTNHSPGPWKIVDTGPHWNNKDINNIEIQFGDDGECVTDHVYMAADASLISAAPDMLAALQQLKELLMHPSNDADESMKELVDMCAAIAKARGLSYE